MIKNILDKLWKGNHKVNNKLDGYWYVRLADVAKILEEELEKDTDDKYKDQEYSQDNGMDRNNSTNHHNTISTV